MIIIYILKDIKMSFTTYVTTKLKYKLQWVDKKQVQVRTNKNNNDDF